MKYKIWTKEDVELLTINYPSKGNKYCQQLLNRTETSIRNKAFELKLTSSAGRYNKMTHQEYEKALIDKDILVFPLEPYIDCRTKIKHTCVEKHIWLITPSHVLSGKGCPSCKKGGFNPNKPAIFYYVKITDSARTMYKTGISNRSVEERFYRDPDKEFTILFLKEYELGSDAKKLEDFYLNKFKNKRVTITNWLKSGGNTELYLEDVLNLDKEN